MKDIFVIKKFLPLDIKEKILIDINFEIDNNFCPSVPKFQTYPNLFNKYKDTKHWDVYFKKLNEEVSRIDSLFKLDVCWANVVKSVSNYEIHTHGENILSTVCFIQNKYKEFGTYFNKDNYEFIIPGEENSLIIFNGAIPHATTMPPEIICKYNSRVTLVTDYCLK